MVKYFAADPDSRSTEIFRREHASRRLIGPRHRRPQNRPGGRRQDGQKMYPVWAAATAEHAEPSGGFRGARATWRILRLSHGGRSGEGPDHPIARSEHAGWASDPERLWIHRNKWSRGPRSAMPHRTAAFGMRKPGHGGIACAGARGRRSGLGYGQRQTSRKSPLAWMHSENRNDRPRWIGPQPRARAAARVRLPEVSRWAW